MKTQIRREIAAVTRHASRVGVVSNRQKAVGSPSAPCATFFQRQGSRGDMQSATKRDERRTTFTRAPTARCNSGVSAGSAGTATISPKRAILRRPFGAAKTVGIQSRFLDDDRDGIVVEPRLHLSRWRLARNDFAECMRSARRATARRLLALWSWLYTRWTITNSLTLLATIVGATINIFEQVCLASPRARSILAPEHATIRMRAGSSRAM